MFARYAISGILFVGMMACSSLAKAQTHPPFSPAEYSNIRHSATRLAVDVRQLGQAIDAFLSPRDATKLLDRVQLVEPELAHFVALLPSASKNDVLKAFDAMDADLHRLLADTLLENQHHTLDAKVQRVMDADDDLHRVLFHQLPAGVDEVRNAIIHEAYDLETESLRFSGGILRFAGIGAESRPLRAAASQLSFEADRFQEAAVSTNSLAALQRQFHRVENDVYGVTEQVRMSRYSTYFDREAERIHEICNRLETLLYVESER